MQLWTCIDWQLPMLREIGSECREVVCVLCKHDVFTHLTCTKTDSVFLKWIKTVKCNLRTLNKLAIINILNKTNIIYVFNPIILTSIFATDLRWFQFNLTNKQKLYICVSFLLFLNSVELSSPASHSSAPSTVQTGIYISFSLRCIHFTFGVKGFLHCKEKLAYIKNKQASPAQI